MASGSWNSMIVDPPDVLLAVEAQRPMESTIKLSNISEDEMIFFKIRTTNKSKYSVQPANGVIWPNCSTTVTITCPTQLNPPEVGRSSDLFAIQNFKLNLTDVALRKTSIDPSTAFVEFQKQSPKPEINELRLNVCFVADKPINHNGTNLKLTEDMVKVENDRKAEAEQLLMLRAHNESMSLHLNLMQKDVIICNEDKERFKKAIEERVIMEKKALCCTIVILLAIIWCLAT